MRRYLIDSIENMRDMGGYLVDNKKISYGKIIRSNLPNKISKNDLRYLQSIGIREIIDLRSKEEIEKIKSVFESDDNFQVFHYSIKGGNKIPDTSDDVPKSYMNMLEEKENIYNIFKILLETKGGILYFCDAGKDRTGVITALILMTLGVDRKDIIADYILSNEYLIDKLKDFEENCENKKIIEIITPKFEYMDKFLKLFDEKYGSINNYLHQVGIKDDDIQIIKNKYLTYNK